MMLARLYAGRMLANAAGDRTSADAAAPQRHRSDSGDLTARIIGALPGRATARDGIEAALLALASHPARRLDDGCGTDLPAAFERVVRKGQAEGEFAAGLDPREAAQFLAAMLSGLRRAARSGAPPAALKDIVGVAMRCLR